MVKLAVDGQSAVVDGWMGGWIRERRASRLVRTVRRAHLTLHGLLPTATDRPNDRTTDRPTDH